MPPPLLEPPADPPGPAEPPSPLPGAAGRGAAGSGTGGPGAPPQQQLHLCAHSPRQHRPGCVSRDGFDATVTANRAPFRGTSSLQKRRLAGASGARCTGTCFSLPVRLWLGKRLVRSCKAVPRAWEPGHAPDTGWRRVNDTGNCLGGRKAPGLGKL